MRPKASTEGRILGAHELHGMLLAVSLSRVTERDGNRRDAEKHERFRRWRAEGWDDVVLAAYKAKQPIKDEWRWDRPEWEPRDGS